jgi:outer membrane receptor protein involved in Fe transport
MRHYRKVFVVAAKDIIPYIFSNNNWLLMRSFGTVAFILLSLCFGIESAFAQISTGTIRGTIRDVNIPAVNPSGVEKELRILLTEAATRTLVQETSPSSSGTFIFRNVPFSTYDITVMLDSVLLGGKRVVISSPVPKDIVIDSLREYELQGITVEGHSYAQTSSSISTHTLLTASTIQNLESDGNAKKIERILLSTPGVVPDEDGRMHVRGEDAQLQYVVDGIPITGNLTRVYSSLFNASLIKAVDIQTGALDAEYGVAAAGVLAVTTKSGFDKPLFGNASLSYGSFGTVERSLQLGGNLGGSAALYLAGSSSASNRYLDPVSGFSPIHDQGETNSFFGKLNFLTSDKFDITMLGSYDNTRYEIPNGVVKVPPQDQVQDLKNYLLGIRATLMLSSSSLMSVVGYSRYAHSLVTSGGMKQILTSDEALKAIQENEKFFIGADRTNTTNGAQVEYASQSDFFSLHHAMKIGVDGEVYPLKEFFTFAVTNPALSDPNIPGGDSRYAPYDLTRGGTPFLVDRAKTGTRFSAYTQDQIAVHRWVFNAGLRYDEFNLLEQESALSPRVNIAYLWNDDLTLRASYNRIVMQAPLENILVSSSDEARMLTGAEQGNVPTNVRSEREHVFELGGMYKVNDYLDLDLNGYSKLIDNFIVKVELGNSGIIFPVNLKKGFVGGGELTARLRDWKNLSGEMTVTTATSLGIKPSDGSSPIAAGLILGEEGHNYSQPFGGEDMFPTEHNQLFTAVLHLSYALSEEFSANLGARFDSGLPFDLVDSTGKGLDEAASRAELKRRGYSDDVINLLSLKPESPGSPDKSVAPHAVFDVGVRYQFLVSSLKLRTSFSILNVLDTKYLYKFESSFGGTHFGIPRTMMFTLEALY